MQTVKVRKFADGSIYCFQPPWTSRGGDTSSCRSLTSNAKFKNPFHLVSSVVPVDSQGTAHVYPGRGVTPKPCKFTSLGRRTLREFGAVVDEVHGKRCLFLTWTLPGDGLPAIAALAAWSTEVSRSLNQWLRDTVSDVMYAWVFEFQNRGALHQHLLVAAPHWGQLLKVAMLFGSFMYNTLSRVSVKAGVDLFLNTEKGRCNREHFEKGINVQWIEKSAARYLAKYQSKVRTKNNANNPHPPVRWWRVNMSALREIRARRESFSVATPSSDDANLLLRRVLDACVDGGANVFRYRNKQFPWLHNAIISPSCPSSVDGILDTIRSLMGITSNGKGQEFRTAPTLLRRHEVESHDGWLADGLPVLRVIEPVAVDLHSTA